MTINKHITDALCILAFLVAVSAMLLTVYQIYTQKAAVQQDNQIAEQQSEDGKALDSPDGLPLDNFDAVGRVRNNRGTGTGSFFDEDEMYYYLMSLSLIHI